MGSLVVFSEAFEALSGITVDGNRQVPQRRKQNAVKCWPQAVFGPKGKKTTENQRVKDHLPV
jgi:hypothetical protein